MSIDDGELGREQWADLLDDVEPPTHGEVLLALEDRLDLSPQQARAMVEDALEAGVIDEVDSGTFTTLRVAESVEANGDKPQHSDDADGEDAGESVRERALAALTDAVDYYHSHVDDPIPDHQEDGKHPERPETAREYFRARGWSDETIDANRLGWAPPNDTGLLDHLMQRGYDRDAILGTGLFKENLEPLNRGRYMLPYFDADERAIYATGRCTDTGESPGGGAAGYNGHPKDGMAGKYTKLAHTKPYVYVTEPIWGQHTIEAGEPVVIAEGIADAIAATAEGYSVLSPVAKEFSKEHIAPLVTLLKEHDVPRVYVVPDAETAEIGKRDDAPDEAERITDGISLPTTAPGIGGGLRTAAQLRKKGFEALVAQLPRLASTQETRKVDLDDYLNATEAETSLAPVLASAKEPESFLEYEKATRSLRRSASDGAERDESGDTSAVSPGADDRNGSDYDSDHSGTASALFALDVTDLTPAEFSSSGDRGTNPLGHTGTSENYFTLVDGGDGDLLGKDYKRPGNPTYNALTYLLVDKGERAVERPMGPLSNRELLVAWRHAKDLDVIPDDDPIPRRALVHVALERNLCSEEDVVDGWKLPVDAHNAAIEAVRGDLGIDPGLEPLSPGSASGREAVPTIPYDQIADLNDDEARRLLTEKGVEWPSTDEVRDRLRDRMMQAFRAGENVVINAPTSVGKSHITASEPWLRHTNITGDHPVIHLSLTRDARDECIATSQEAGVSSAALKGRKDRCPVARGDHDPAEREDRDDPEIVLTMDGIPASKWIDHQCDNKANPFQLAHSYVAEHNDQDETLPCCDGEFECPAMTQWEGVPRDDDGNPAVDVVHATHQFAYVPGLRAHTNVVIDEAPNAFDVDLPQERIRKAVNAYLNAINAPVKTFEGLVTLAESSSGGGDIGAERDALEAILGNEPDREWYVEHPAAHALAADLTRAIYRAIRWEDPDANGRRSAKVIHHPPRFDENQDEGFGGNFLTVVIDDENTVRSIRHAPDFSRARSVVGLDAHPCEPLWERNVGPQVDCEALLTPDERRLWRRFERGLTVVQVGDATRPRSGDAAREWDESDTKLDVLIPALRDRYGEDFRTGVTGAAVEASFRSRYVDAGVPDPETMHYGEEMSRNDFAGEPVGLINGCIDPGDDYVIDLLAELELDAWAARVDPADLEEPRDALCDACSGRTCSECNQTGLKRKAGRGFVGPDADVAAELLASVRENHVAQAVGRYARNPDDPDDTAIVYVRTDAIPNGFADVKVNGVEGVATETQREIISELVDRGNDGATVKGLMEDVGCGSSHTADTLNKFEERGLTEREAGRGPNPDRWFATIDTLEHGSVDRVELLERRRETAENERTTETADNGEKASAATYKELVCASGSFSAENEELSAAAEIDALVAGAANDTHPGPLAVPIEELQDVYELS